MNSIDELLLNAQIKQVFERYCRDPADLISRKGEFELKLKELRQHLLDSSSLPPQTYKSIREMLVKVSGIQIPFPEWEYHGNERSTTNNAHTIAFVPPTTVSLVGSYLLKTLVVGSSLDRVNVDICVKIPNCFFHSKDYLNNSFFQKRAIYAALIAHNLSLKYEKNNIRYQLAHNNFRFKTNLIITFPTFPLVDIVIRFMIDEDLFPITKLAPVRNSLRLYYLKQQPQKIITSYDQEISTPIYNSFILEDMLYLKNLVILNGISKDAENFVDAVKLAKIWIKSRGIFNDSTSLSGFLASVTIGYILVSGIVSKFGSAWEIFQGFLRFFSDQKYLSIGLKFPNDKLKEKECVNEFSLDSFKEAFNAVLIDIGGNFNFFFNLSLQSSRQIAAEATQSLRWISIAKQDQLFLHLFSCRSIENSFVFNASKFDRIFSLDIDWLMKRENFTTRRYQIFASQSGDSFNAILRWIPWLLQNSMKSRISFVVPIRKKKELDFSLNYDMGNFSSFFELEASNNQQQEKLFLFGLCFVNPQDAYNPLEKGPLTDNENLCSEFRIIWKDLAQLKRFHDGAIHEVVEWDGIKENVPIKMITHLLGAHASLDPQNLHFQPEITEPFLPILRTAVFIKENEIKKAFIGLTKILKSTDEESMSISEIIAVDSAFRQCNARQIWNEYAPLQVIVKFDSSCQWPDDREATQAFERILLYKFYQKFANVDDSNCQFINLASEFCYLDVKYHGFLFRIGGFSPCHESDNILIPIVKYLAYLSSKYPMFCKLSRTVKFWLNSQLLLGEFENEEFIDICLAKIFVEYANVDSFSLNRLMNIFLWRCREIFTDSYDYGDTRKNTITTIGNATTLSKDIDYNDNLGEYSIPWKEIREFLSSKKPINSLIFRRIYHLATSPELSSLIKLAIKDFDLVMEFRNDYLNQTPSNFPIDHANVPDVRLLFLNKLKDVFAGECIILADFLEFSIVAVTITKHDKKEDIIKQILEYSVEFLKVKR